MTTPIDFDLDQHQVRRAFSRAAKGYDEAAVLQQEVCDRLGMRLDYIKFKPQKILDLGAGSGIASQMLMTRYKRARVYALDFAEPMLKLAASRGSWLNRPKAVCADALKLPLKDQSIDLVFSNLMLQWCHPLDNYFAEMRRVLGPGGLLLFSTFGPDTVKELREAWQAVDGRSHVHQFIDMHDIGDMLVGARFTEPVVNMEMFTLTYSDIKTLLKDLKAIGATNAASSRTKGLTGKGTYRELEAAYEQFRNAENKLPLSYEVIYGTAWVSDAPQPSSLPDQHTILQKQ